MTTRLVLPLLCLLLVACGYSPRRDGLRPLPRSDYEIVDGPPGQPFDVSKVPEPVPRDEPLAPYGNQSPYEVFGKRYYVLPSRSGYVERGIASWYGTKFHGRLTSTREPFDMYQFTAAHKTLPLPSYARVTRLDNGRSVVVRINDRGPFVGDRLIDLSYAAAVKLDMHLIGTAPVEVRVLEPESRAPPPPQPVPRPLPTVEPQDASWIQVGAFSARENAIAYRARLRAAGFSKVRVFRARLHDGVVWRVRIGPLDGQTADAVRQRLLDRGFEQPRLIRR